jgi:hypothetical protein
MGAVMPLATKAMADLIRVGEKYHCVDDAFGTPSLKVFELLLNRSGFAHTRLLSVKRHTTTMAAAFSHSLNLLFRVDIYLAAKNNSISIIKSYNIIAERLC